MKKILFLPNWRVKKLNEKPMKLQSPDYYTDMEQYWFFRYFKQKFKIDIIDTHSIDFIEKFEKYKLRFYVIQALKAIPKLNQYDYIISHSAQSAIVVGVWRRLFRTKSKHIVFDIGSFNSAAEKGVALKLMQWASKSFDYLIYHTSKQSEYYTKFYPWLINKSKFIRFGTDLEYFKLEQNNVENNEERYIICVGYSKRDWDTLVQAFIQIDTSIKLRLVGHVDSKYEGIHNVEQVSYIPIDELIVQISNADFCVLPLKSFNYSYGQMTLLQQMALKKCVLTAKVPSLVDYIIDGETALFYEPENVEDLKDKMTNLINDSLLCQSIGVNARNYLEENCNEIIMASQIERIVESLSNK